VAVVDERTRGPAPHADVQDRPVDPLLEAPTTHQPPVTASAPAATVLPTVDPSVPRHVPTGALARAMGAWLLMVYLVCWVGLPLASVAITGSSGSLFVSGVLNAPVFLLATLVTVVAAAVANPTVVLATDTRRDPVVSAFAGGLLSWAVIHNVMPFLIPFAAMSTPGLAILVAINVVEMALVGMMLASFTRSHAVAFGLGAGLRWLIAGLLTLYWMG